MDPLPNLGAPQAPPPTDTQSTELPPTPQPTKSSSTTPPSKSKSKVFWIIGSLILALSILAIYLYQQNTQLKQDLEMAMLSGTTIVDTQISPTLSNRCDLEPDPGDCEGAFPSYYFDQSDNICKEFSWGGCGSTQPFTTLLECQTACQTSPTPTTNWEIYANNTYRYSFKYPSSFVLNTETLLSNSVVEFFDNNNDSQKVSTFSLIVSNNEVSKELQAICLERVGESTRGNFPDGSSDQTSVSFKQQSIDGITACRQELNSETDIVINTIFEKDGYIYIIQLVTNKNKEGYKEIYDQILSTFQFTDNSQTETKDVESKCISVSGIWLAEHNECTKITKEACYEIGGKKYHGCASACRHDSLAETDPCISVCVQVCNL